MALQYDEMCKAEIGQAPHWHMCGRRAVVSVQTASCTLQYCEKHRSHASDKTGRYFKTRPFAEPQEIRRNDRG